MSLITILIFGIVVLITHFLEGITGFGCTVLALPFCILLVGIKTAVPVLMILAWLLALYVIIIDFKNIVWKEFLNIVLFVGLGLPIGIFMFSNFDDKILKIILGIFMILVAVRGLYVSFGRNSKVKNINKHLLNFILFCGGIIHGAFASGGPFVVIYATRALKNKSNFRATLCTLWFTLNSVILVQNLVKGSITFSMVKLLIFSLPFLAAGMILGNIAHNKVNEDIFIKLVYGVLFLSGFFMFL